MQFDGYITAPQTQFYNIGRATTAASNKVQIEASDAIFPSGIKKYVFVGHIQDVRHYFYALTADEISSIYEKGFNSRYNSNSSSSSVSSLAIDCFHLFGYKYLANLTALLKKHPLVPPFFFCMDRVEDTPEIALGHCIDDYNQRSIDFDNNTATASAMVIANDDGDGDTHTYVLNNDSLMQNRQNISTFDSAKWFKLFFKIFRMGTLKLRGEIALFLAKILENNYCDITISDIAYALSFVYIQKVCVLKNSLAFYFFLNNLQKVFLKKIFFKTHSSLFFC